MKRETKCISIYLQSFTCVYMMLSIRYFRLLCVRLRAVASPIRKSTVEWVEYATPMEYN